MTRKHPYQTFRLVTRVETFGFLTRPVSDRRSRTVSGHLETRPHLPPGRTERREAPKGPNGGCERRYTEPILRSELMWGRGPPNITSKHFKAIYRHLERKVLVGLGWWKKCECWRTTVGIAHVWEVLSNKLPFGCTHLRSRSHGDPLSTGGITGVAGSVKG